MLKLLIADDAPDIAEVIAFAARMTWPDCVVTLAATGEEALQRFAAISPDLVILDVSMPPPDGFEVCRHLREISGVPIVILTVRDALSDKRKALTLGADLYLTKPFDPMVLLACLEGLVQSARWMPKASQRTLKIGPLSIDFRSRRVSLAGERLQLTATEYRLLGEFVFSQGASLPRQTLMERIWGIGCTRDTQPVDFIAERLRVKLRAQGDSPLDVRRDGNLAYRFVAPT